MTPAAQIDKAQRIVGAIDKRIDAVRIELFRNEVVDDLSAHSWQMAWDKHPVLRAIETSLFLRRADAADIRDHLIAKAEKAAERRAVRASLKQYQLSRHECPACGLTHLAAL